MEKLNVHIKPLGFMDLLAFKNLVPARRKRLLSGSDAPLPACPPVNRLAASLHPKSQCFTVSAVTRETADVVSYTLVPDKGKGTERCAYFRAGQYVSVRLSIDGVSVSRPVSISSSPAEALRGYYILTVKKQADGFVSPWIHEHWKVGTQVETSGPEGDFFYEPLRDKPTVIGLAGGCGITPFRSMARAIAEGTEDFRLVLLYGSRRECDIVFNEELETLAVRSGGKVSLVSVLSDEPGRGTESGFITRAMIEKYAGDISGVSFFLCGPQAMYDFIDRELAPLALKPKVFRRELYGELKNIARHPGYPAKAADGVFTLTVNSLGETRKVKAAAGESVLTALERGGVKAPARCRSGKCGYCRARLLGGKVFYPEDQEGRRKSDLKFGFIHPCSSYPLGDLEIEIYPD